ncbi:DUF4251 domain-containing protein [Winogradskyella aurantia]|uniref:DUF4251 domain-containing protein n=1 Tax=Winogradskyella aurantia TaxID=1915063 RepID=A0A265UTA5_9FLAO|nr:DUF4251 domain-containing protein [Winogradskyella aurantia]OZV68452.1 hypothetical protein CA834_08205 [Winogradskyella aurantia]
MKKSVLILFPIAVFLMGCSTTKTSMDKQDQLNKLNNISNYIENKQFRFDAEQAFPLQTAAVSDFSNKYLNYTGNNAGRIRLESGYFLRVEGDSTNAVLPFIGEYRAANYNTASNGNISFNSTVKDYSYEVDTKKNSIQLKFAASKGTESFDMFLEIFPNHFSTLYVSSSNRTQIRYTGHIKPLDNED